MSTYETGQMRNHIRETNQQSSRLFHGWLFIKSGFHNSQCIAAVVSCLFTLRYACYWIIVDFPDNGAVEWYALKKSVCGVNYSIDRGCFIINVCHISKAFLCAIEQSRYVCILYIYSINILHIYSCSCLSYGCCGCYQAPIAFLS